jgi:hypothetical protein
MPGRRLVGPGIQLTQRAWEDVAPELERLINRLWDSEANGIPAGFLNFLPSNTEAGSAGAAGLETAGWAAADHEHPVDTDVPSGLANANTEGTSPAIPRLDHQHKRDARVMGDGSDVGTRNAVNFTGDAIVADDGGGDKVDVQVAPVASSWYRHFMHW